MNKFKGIIIVVVVIVLAIVILSACSDNDRYSYNGDDWGANFDWGDDYYWDTNSHSVEKKLMELPEEQLLQISTIPIIRTAKTIKAIIPR